jgi:hypothetical protein
MCVSVVNKRYSVDRSTSFYLEFNTSRRNYIPPQSTQTIFSGIRINSFSCDFNSSCDMTIMACEIDSRPSYNIVLLFFIFPLFHSLIPFLNFFYCFRGKLLIVIREQKPKKKVCVLCVTNLPISNIALSLW